MSSNSSFHHTTSSIGAQAEMQEAGAARWSNLSEEKGKEPETESEHREMSATLHYVLSTHNFKMFTHTSSKSGKLLHLQNDHDNMTIFMHECWKLYYETLLNYCDHQIYTWQSKKLSNCLHVALETSSGMKTCNNFSLTCSAFRPKLITIPTPLLNVVKVELTFTGEGLFCISQCIVVGFLASSSRSL